MVSANASNTPQKSVGSRRLPLHSICPYFAMFPESFVRRHVQRYAKEGEWVFDPFCGRGTTILEALLLGRNAAGSDINPVAFCVSLAKAQRPSLDLVKRRVAQLEKASRQTDQNKLEMSRRVLPRFFKRAFYHSTLRELLFLRATLDWRNNRTDRFLTALILGSLHGDMDRSNAYFSNQMPRMVCLKPAYSLRYWASRHLFPKKRNVFDMLAEKAEFRLKELPEFGHGRVKQLDARVVGRSFKKLEGKIKLVITSPPYLGVTRYEEDQWLRLWFLGGDPRPTYGKFSTDDRHESVQNYWKFLTESWNGIRPLIASRATLVIRLGGIGMETGDMTFQLKSSINTAFPRARLIQRPGRSEIVGRQTRCFLPKSTGCRYELDYVFKL